MTLITVREKKVLAMPNLFRYVLKFIYDEKNMSAGEVRTMQESIVNWHNAINLEKEKLNATQRIDIQMFGRVLTTHHRYSEEEYNLEMMCAMLRDNDEGVFDERKISFKEKGIDYRKFHHLPEAYDLKGLVDGAKALEESNKREGINAD